MESENSTKGLFNLDRLNGLSDGVIAIALTLLVLAIDIPTDHNFSRDGLRQFMIKLEPSLLAYVSSFIVIAIYWVQHYAIFRNMKHSNQLFLWLNVLFLFAISLAPFISKVKTLYRFDPGVITLFALTNIFTGLILYRMWKYVVSHPELQKDSISASLNRSLSRRILIVPVVCIIAIPLAYLDAHIASYVFVLAPIIYIGFKNTHAG
jgi:uncharacterized membrane protein